MKIVFKIYKNSYYRIFSCLIKELLDNNFEIELWHFFLDMKVVPSVKESPFYEYARTGVKFKKIYSDQEYIKALSENNFDYYFSLHPLLINLPKDLLKKEAKIPSPTAKKIQNKP